MRMWKWGEREMGGECGNVQRVECSDDVAMMHLLQIKWKASWL